MSRPSGRQRNQLRKIRFNRNYTKYAEGSVLAEFGETKVLCNATLEERVPRWMKKNQEGWITAEYGMLPRSTSERTERGTIFNKQNGRTIEIRRLIGRSLRAAVDLKALREYTIIVDCDVLQADGGTRTASISGGWIALYDAIQTLIHSRKIVKNPILSHVASISVGIFSGIPILDLDYAEDSSADTDMNVVMNENGKFIEVQGTAENLPFSFEEMNIMLDLAHNGIKKLIELQRRVIMS